MSLVSGAALDPQAGLLAAALGVGWLALSWLCQPSLGGARRRWVIGLVVACVSIVGLQCAFLGLARVIEGATDLIASAAPTGNLELLTPALPIVLLLPAMLISLLDGSGLKTVGRLAQCARAWRRAPRRQGPCDPMTDLSTLKQFNRRLERAARRSDRAGRGLALLCIDVDGFKPINDAFGHAFGDAVLRELASRLVAQLRGADAVARSGGDGFVVLLDGPCEAEVTSRVAQRIIAAASAPMSVGGREVRLSCSIGVAMYPADGPRAQLLGHAGAAMQVARRTGGSRCQFFRPNLEAGAGEQVDLHHDLRMALDRGGELELHYQPKVRASDSAVTGVEAWLRWQHPLCGPVEPDRFIPVAERFGLIGALGNWVIDEVCRQMAAWRLEGLRIPVAINLSAHQLLQDDLPLRVEQALSRHALSPGLLTFEIGESAAIADGSGAMLALERLRQIGARLAIGDFGAGYSSLAHLRRFRVDQLKIDRSFMQDLETSADARAIVGAVVQMGHALDLKVVAEGVERDGQRQALLELECDELQGCLFARPMTARAVSRLAAGCGQAPLKFSRSTFVAEGPAGSSVVFEVEDDEA